MLAGLREERCWGIISVVILYDRVAERGGCGRSGVAERLAVRDEQISWWVYRCWRSHSKQIKCPSGMLGAMYEAQRVDLRDADEGEMVVASKVECTQASARFPRFPKPDSSGRLSGTITLPASRTVACSGRRPFWAHSSFFLPPVVRPVCNMTYSAIRRARGKLAATRRVQNLSLYLPQHSSSERSPW